MEDAPALRFGRFELHGRQRRLLRDGAPVAIGARAFDVLTALVERRERLVAKAELLEIVWPGLVVEENNLQVQVSSLRRLLGPQAIATIPGRGYQFTAALEGGAPGKPTVAAPDAISVAAPSAAPTGPSTNLPTQLLPLYGREADLLALRPLIIGHRLVTVVGSGGIGKSRVAQAVAHSLASCQPDGAWMVELAGLSSPPLLPNVVAHALGIALPRQDVALDDLSAALARRTLLLVLDNCEHLLDATASLVQIIATRAPNVTLLATSQQPLHLPIEQQYRLAPLTVPPETTASDARQFGSLALFEARVQAVDPRFRLNEENLPAVIDICRQLDGLPLAIELAAARVPALGLRVVRDNLGARFRLLTGGSRAASRRHPSLRAALKWSYDLLGVDEQVVFRRLGVFAGGFNMETAQAVVCDVQLDEWAVLDHLGTLVDKSLVVVDTADSPRYRLLESARHFALEQLDRGETASIQRRHALAMLTFVQRLDDEELDAEELPRAQYASRALPELDNLRAAYAWATGAAGDMAIAVALAAHSGLLIEYAVEFAEWLVALRQHVEAGGIDPAIAARFWLAISRGSMVRFVPHSVQVEAARRAQSLYQSLGQPRRVVFTLFQLTRHYRTQQADLLARAVADEARGLIQADWPAMFRTQMLRIDASAARRAGQYFEALALHHEVIGVSASAGNWRREVADRTNLVDLMWQCCPLEEAAREARRLADATHARPTTDYHMVAVYGNLASILSEMGHIEEASAAARGALPMMRRTRDYFLEMWVHLFWRRGQFEVAATLLGASDSIQAREGVPLFPNEQRLVAQARTALAEKLHPDVFSKGHAVGAALDERDLLARASTALEQPNATSS